MTGWSTARSACCASSIPKAAFRHWIDEGDAADLRFSGDAQGAPLGARRRSTASMSSSSPTSRAGKRLLVADMDSTIIGQECIDELADYAGLKDKVARITERAMQGELDFPGGACASGCGCSPASTSARSSRCLDERVDLTAGAETLVQTMRAGGASCLLVSGGFLSFAEPVAQTVGFDRVKANRLSSPAAS